MPGSKDLLDSQVTDLLASARAAWPSVRLDDADVIAYWTERSNGDLSELCTDDLYLACACAASDDAAIAAFHSAYLQDLRAAIGTVDGSASFCDDVSQRLLEHLFVGTETTGAKIGNYSGCGQLYSWCRVVAIRMALAAAKRASREVAVESVELSDVVDPSLDSLKQTYRSEFKRVFAEVLSELEPGERTMLRMNVIDGLSVDELGRLHGVHRATAARWLQKLRDHIAKRTRAKLRDELKLEAKEDVDSVLRLIASQFDVSLRRHLATVPGAVGDREPD